MRASMPTGILRAPIGRESPAQPPATRACERGPPGVDGRRHGSGHASPGPQASRQPEGHALAQRPATAASEPRTQFARSRSRSAAVHEDLGRRGTGRHADASARPASQPGSISLCILDQIGRQPRTGSPLPAADSSWSCCGRRRPAPGRPAPPARARHAGGSASRSRCRRGPGPRCPDSARRSASMSRARVVDAQGGLRDVGDVAGPGRSCSAATSAGVETRCTGAVDGAHRALHFLVARMTDHHDSNRRAVRSAAPAGAPWRPAGRSRR